MNQIVVSQRLVAVVICAAFLFAIGCSSEVPATAQPNGTGTTVPSDAHDHDLGAHDHASTGPHEGQIIELGDEDYHAELVHDEEKGTVTIYILDGTAKNAVAIDATELSINLKQAGKGRQFKLAATPQDGDSTGKASRFVSNDKDLNEALDAEEATARLVVEIEGKSYTGKLEHHHDHEGHDHKH